MEGSNSRHRAAQALARVHRRAGNRPRRWWEANRLVAGHDELVFETLRLTGMKALWGRKALDYAFNSFPGKVSGLAAKSGRVFRQRDRCGTTSKRCSCPMGGKPQTRPGERSLKGPALTLPSCTDVAVRRGFTPSVKTYPFLLIICAACAFTGGVSAQADSGGGWKQDMRAELAAWRATPVAVDLASLRDELPLGVRADLALRPNAELKFLVTPRRAPKPDSFGGMAAFEVPRDGLYRVSSGSSVWIIVVETGTGQSVPSRSFEEQPKSDLHKVVVFPLRAGARYTLQISGSKAAVASILITQAPDPKN